MVVDAVMQHFSISNRRGLLLIFQCHMENTDVYFHALACFYCKRNRYYRIFIRPDELIFIWAGSGSEGLAGARAVATRGGVGAAIGKALESKLDSSRKNQSRIQILDQTPLDQLIGDHSNNIRAPVAGFEQVWIRPRSDSHARGFSDHGHQARLFLRHRALGRYRLGIASMQDTQVAIKELTRIFGDRCRVEIPWPEQEQKCTCVFCKRIRGEH
jgi:hypothetical protein